MKKNQCNPDFLPEEFRPLLNVHRYTASKLGPGELEREFTADVDLLAANLLPEATNVLDLACGLGIASALLSRKLKRPGLKFHLFDKDFISSDLLLSEFHPDGAVFNNSFAGARRVIENLGLPAEDFLFVDASAENLAQMPQMDLIFSFAGWGYCFPVDTYLEEVVSRLKPGGTLISDVRVDACAGFRDGEKKISDRLGVFPDVIFTNFAADYLYAGKHRLADSLPSGTRLKSCRFRWVRPKK